MKKKFDIDKKQLEDNLDSLENKCLDRSLYYITGTFSEVIGVNKDYSMEDSSELDWEKPNFYKQHEIINNLDKISTIKIEL
tara:strand:- start:1421 stop:1663 length:243 start_codon:yes stop_codon:yes gene_type:complete